MNEKPTKLYLVQCQQKMDTKIFAAKTSFLKRFRQTWTCAKQSFWRPMFSAESSRSTRDVRKFFDKLDKIASNLFDFFF